MRYAKKTRSFPVTWWCPATSEEPAIHCASHPWCTHSLQSKVYGKLLSTPKYPLKDADGHTLKKGQRVQIKVKSAGRPCKHCCFCYTAKCTLDARLDASCIADVSHSRGS